MGDWLSQDPTVADCYCKVRLVVGVERSGLEVD